MLPKSIDPEYLLGKAAPADVTVGEMLRAYVATASWKAVLAATHDRARLSVKWSDSGKPVPDGMTLGEMRKRVLDGTVVISIDDGLGGELVD